MATYITVEQQGGDALLAQSKRELEVNRSVRIEAEADQKAAQSAIADLEANGVVSDGGFRVEVNGNVVSINPTGSRKRAATPASIRAEGAVSGGRFSRPGSWRVKHEPAANRRSTGLGHAWLWKNFETSNSQEVYYQGPYNYLSFYFGTVDKTRKRELRLAKADGTGVLVAATVEYTISGLPSPSLNVISDFPGLGYNSNGEPLSGIEATANVIHEAFNTSDCSYFVLPAGKSDFVLVVASHYSYGYHYRNQSFTWAYVTGGDYLDIDRFSGQLNLMLGPWGISNDSSRTFVAYLFRNGQLSSVAIPAKLQSLLDKFLPPAQAFAYQHRTDYDTYESINYQRITPSASYGGAAFVCTDGYPDNTSEVVYTPEVFELLNSFESYTQQPFVQVPANKKQPLPNWPKGDWLATGAFEFVNGEVSADPDWLGFFHDAGLKSLPYALWGAVGQKPDMRVYGSKKEQLGLPTPVPNPSATLRLSASRTSFPTSADAALDKIVVYDWDNPSYCRKMLSELGFNL